MARLPSLKALRAFEAAGRRSSLTKASEELNVSQGAISHQVSALERELGYALFRRLSKGVELTDKGAELLGILSAAFGQISRILDELGEDGHQLKLLVQPAFATRWLLPRLNNFHARYPKINLRITATLEALDFHSGNDAAIVGLMEPPAAFEATELFKEYATPVCSSEFLARYGPFNQPSDLIGKPMFKVVIPRTARASYHDNYWSRWFRAMGVEVSEPASLQECDTLNSAIHSAERGHGLVLTDYFLTQDELQRRSVVMPFNSVVDQGVKYYFVYPKEGNLGQLTKLRDWLVAETSQARLPENLDIFRLEAGRQVR